MRILLTGASGFIGRHVLAEALAAGHEVIAVSTRPAPAASPAEWLVADLLAPGEAARVGASAKADVLVHLAWTATPGQFWTDPANLDWVGASLALLRAVADSGVRRVCMVGTCYEYAWPDDADCVENVTPLAPHTLYGVSKDACRRAAEGFCRQQGIGFAWARLFNLYGPAEHPARLVSSVARSLIAGQPAECSRGLAVRDWMDARDAGAAIAALATSTIDGPVNVATGIGTSVADMARTLGRLAGRDDLVRLGALPDRPEPPRITADVTRLRREVGFTQRHDLAAGLADVLAYWRGQTP